MILLDSGEIRLTDFGAAIRGHPEANEAEDLCKEYSASVAPEGYTASGYGVDADDEMVAFDTRYDMWGLGTTLLMMLEGDVTQRSSHFELLEVGSPALACRRRHRLAPLQLWATTHHTARL